MTTPKSEFRNDSGGVQGVVVIREGKEHGTALKPGESIWLTEEEQIATANAPKKDSDNPFQNGSLTLVTQAQEIANRRPIGDPQTGKNASSRETEEEAKARIAKQKAAAEKRKAEEAERTKRAQAQAEQPATPVEDSGATISPAGRPTHGKRGAGEEVATPEAVGAGAKTEAGE